VLHAGGWLTRGGTRLRRRHVVLARVCPARPARG